MFDNMVPTETPSPGTPQRSRILELDALRALAAINLMLFHFTWVYSEKYGFTSELPYLYPYGKYGTQMFFMLSGLVNALTLFRKQSASHYVKSRFIRIVPPFLCVMALNLWLVQWLPLSEHVQVTPASVAANMTMLPNLFGFECIEPVTWTLQIELQFYAIFLILFSCGFLRKPFWPLMGCLSICAVLGTIGHRVDPLWLGTPLLHWFNELLIVHYFPLFAMGIFIHLGYLEPKKWWLYGTGLLFATVVFQGIDPRGASPVVTLGLIGLLIFSQYGWLPVLRVKPLLFISGISYSLYLLHNNLGSVLIYYLNQTGVSSIASVGVATGLTILLAWMANRWLERPLGNWFRRLLTRENVENLPRALASEPGVSVSNTTLADPTNS